MWRRTRSTVRRVVVSLLMLATLLVYAVPSHASLLPHHPSEATHQHALVDAHDDGTVALAGYDIADYDDEQGPCEDLGLLDDGACCSVAQCTTMHGGLPVALTTAFVPRLNASIRLPALATPDGIGIDPALRPPL